MSAIEALRAARDLGVELTVARRGWLLPKIAPGSTGKSAFSKWFGRYIGMYGITDSRKVFHSFRHTFVDALRFAGVADEINIALLGHTDPSVHDKYGAKDKAIRFRHRLAEAVASVAYAGLDLSHLSSHRATHVHRRPPNAEGSRRGGER